MKSEFFELKKSKWKINTKSNKFGWCNRINLIIY